ncbi:sensor histidine kinase [Allorhizobium sp. BGMRC 0089]|nr:sensor histidine kinase [Allorhizobium sonneratiae]MCM2294584.1 sensor histidine kinase [Allorhizobium sonneratiae]
MVQRLTWFKQQYDVDVLRDFFITGLQDMGASLSLQDRNGNYICITSLPSRWPLAIGQEPSDESIFGETIAASLKAAKARLSVVGDIISLQIEPGDDTIFEFRCRLIEVGSIGVCFMTVVMDRTEERRRERLLRTLLREVSHRSKNLLAIIQSIASQTARYSGTLDQFLGKFRGRLHALSTSQDLITDSSWRGAYFNDLVEQQLEKYVPELAALVVISGENIMLNPNASLHIGLALHELIVNAVSHGDFLKRREQIQISCDRLIAEDGQGAFIRVRWLEPLGRLEDSSVERDFGRFGSTVLEKVVPAAVNGQVLHRMKEGRLCYELLFPADLHE